MPAMVQVWCGHEYTVKNLEFAAYVGAACSIDLYWVVMQQVLGGNAAKAYLHARLFWGMYARACGHARSISGRLCRDAADSTAEGVISEARLRVCEWQQ